MRNFILIVIYFPSLQNHNIDHGEFIDVKIPETLEVYQMHLWELNREPLGQMCDNH